MLRLSENINKYKENGQIGFMVDVIHDFGYDDVENDIKSIKELNEILEVGIDGFKYNYELEE
jgi:hypothetical protein